eukprot:GHUV01054718.1.p1 GENE.GHUV01054718.1~~GHUV01054718.1.p1  ORF type:complete len:151 (+),score=23.45 GHUV01054718.1:149-601(+)
MARQPHAIMQMISHAQMNMAAWQAEGSTSEVCNTVASHVIDSAVGDASQLYDTCATATQPPMLMIQQVRDVAWITVAHSHISRCTRRLSLSCCSRQPLLCVSPIEYVSLLGPNLPVLRYSGSMYEGVPTSRLSRTVDTGATGSPPASGPC